MPIGYIRIPQIFCCIWMKSACAGQTDTDTSHAAELNIHFYFNSPKTATPVGVPIYTLPFTIMGVMNLLPLPKLSRPPAA